MPFNPSAVRDGQQKLQNNEGEAYWLYRDTNLRQRPWRDPSSIVAQMWSRKPGWCRGLGRSVPLAFMRCRRYVHNHGRPLPGAVEGHRRECHLNALHLGGGERQIDMLRWPAPTVRQKRFGGLESFGGFRDTAERCLLPPPDAEVPVHQLDALVCLGFDVMRGA